MSFRSFVNGILILFIGVPVLSQVPYQWEDTSSMRDTVPVIVSCACFRGQPSPHCCSFVLFESGIKLRLSQSSTREGKGNGLFTLDLGYMRNLSSASGVGGSLYFAADDDGHRFGFKPRYRYWLGRRISVDLSPGVLFTGDDNNVEPKFPAFVGAVSLSYADWFALSTQVEVIRFKQVVYDFSAMSSRLEDGTKSEVYAGITLCSYAGIGGLVGIAIIYAIAMATYHGPFSGIS